LIVCGANIDANSYSLLLSRGKNNIEKLVSNYTC
jgi:hypothetical protein